MVSHTYPSGTDLTGSPSHSAYWRDQILPAIQGRLEPQIYATSGSLPASGDYVGQRAFVGSGTAMSEYIYNGTSWILWSAPERAVTITAAGWSAGGWGNGVWVSKSSGLVTVHVGANGTSGIGIALCTLPAGFRPPNNAAILPGARQGWAPGIMHVQTNGVLSIAVDGTAATQWYASASFWGGY